jgi:hypothetical protein
MMAGRSSSRVAEQPPTNITRDSNVGFGGAGPAGAPKTDLSARLPTVAPAAGHGVMGRPVANDISGFRPRLLM